MSSRRGSRRSRDNYSVARVRAVRRGRIIWVVVVLVLVSAAAASGVTAQGKDILVHVQRFMLFYSGVLALVALTAAVGVGIVAADRIVMAPASRVVAQAVHRATSFAALAFLVTHIVLEILAHRSHVIDAFVPFLARGRTFYIGLGTVASDLVVLLVVTGIARGRFAAKSPWTWRAIHATAYLCWPLSIVHGLLAGRTAKPYVDWSYGACVAAVALALVIRFVATIRTHREKAAHPLPDHFSSVLQGAVPAMPQPDVYDRWGAVPQAHDPLGAIPRVRGTQGTMPQAHGMQDAMPQARRMPRALPPGGSSQEAGPRQQPPPPYITTRRLATPRPDLPIPQPHQQEMRPWQQQEWQQQQQDMTPWEQHLVSQEPDPPEYPPDPAYPTYPGAEGS